MHRRKVKSLAYSNHPVHLHFSRGSQLLFSHRGYLSFLFSFFSVRFERLARVPRHSKLFLRAALKRSWRDNKLLINVCYRAVFNPSIASRNLTRLSLFSPPFAPRRKDYSR